MLIGKNISTSVLFDLYRFKSMRSFRFLLCETYSKKIVLSGDLVCSVIHSRKKMGVSYKRKRTDEEKEEDFGVSSADEDNAADFEKTRTTFQRNNERSGKRKILLPTKHKGKLIRKVQALHLILFIVYLFTLCEKKSIKKKYIIMCGFSNDVHL